MVSNTKYFHTSVCLTENEHIQLEVYANADEASLSSEIRSAVRLYITVRNQKNYESLVDSENLHLNAPDPGRKKNKEFHTSVCLTEEEHNNLVNYSRMDESGISSEIRSALRAYFAVRDKQKYELLFNNEPKIPGNSGERR